MSTTTLHFHSDILICTECVQLIANGEGEDERNEALMARWPGERFTIAIGEDFGHYIDPCQACGDRHHGDRVKAMVFERRPAEPPTSPVTSSELTTTLLALIEDGVSDKAISEALRAIEAPNFARGFEAGNYGAAYVSEALETAWHENGADRGDTVAFRQGFVLGFYSTHDHDEIPSQHRAEFAGAYARWEGAAHITQAPLGWDSAQA